MKSQKVIALLLSTALTISTCIPLGNITALGAEAGTAAQAVEVQEDTSDSAETAESQEEETAPEEAPEAAEAAGEPSAETEVDSADGQAAAVEETEAAEAEDLENENAAAEVEDDSNESLDATEEAAPAQTEETPAADEEAASADPEEASVPSAETQAEEITDLTAPAETETVRTDAQNSLVTPDSADFSKATEIKAGDQYDVNIAEEDDYVLYRFVPEETAKYSFYSDNNNGDPKAALYLGDQSFVNYWDDESGSNFRIEKIFTEGETYYFEAGMFSGTGSYTVHLEKNDSEFEADCVGSSSRTVSPGDEVTLEVAVISSSAVSYQWYDTNYDPIEGATASSYTFTPPTGGSYYCNVSDENENSINVYFSISIENNLKAYPEGLDEGHDYQYVYVTPHSSADLKVNVSAADMTNLTYKWYDSNYNPIENAEQTTLTIDSVTEYTRYYFEVSDSYGNNRSVTFYVYVDNHLDAYTLDENGDHTTDRNLYVSPKESAELNVYASADDMSNLKYTWYKDDIEIENEGSASLSTDPATGYNQYSCKVYDPYGNNKYVYFNVYVENHLEAYTINEYGGHATYRNIQAEPNSSLDLEVIVSADDMSELTYSWFDEDGNLIEGANSTTYSVGPITGRGEYQFQVSDPYGNNRYVNFYINVKNNLEAYPEGERYNTEKTIYTAPKSSLDLKVNVTANDTSQLTYEWYKNDDLIEGYSSTAYHIDAVTEYNHYTFAVSDQYDNREYVHFYVHVDNKLNAYPEGEDEDSNNTEISVAPRASADLKVIVSAEDTSQLTYEWYDDNWDVIEGAASTTFKINSVTTKERYSFKVSDQYGNSEYVTFDVQVENNLLAYPKGCDPYSTYKNVYVLPNSPAVLNVIVTAEDESELTYEWRDSSYDLIPDSTSTSYRIESVTKEDRYSFKVYDQYGNSCEVDFHIMVDNDLAVEAVDGKTYFDVAPGDSVELGVIATADDSSRITYSWRDSTHDRALDNAASSYTIASAESSTDYECCVSDQYGHTEYVYFYVNINHFDAYAEGTENSDSVDLYVPEGQAVDLNVIASADDLSQVKYSWYDDTGLIENASMPSYRVNSVTMQQDYHCQVSDQYGNSTTIYFYLHVENHFKAYPEGEPENSSRKIFRIKSGESVTMKAVVSADDMTGLTYKWQDGDSYQGGHQPYTGGPSYTLDAVTESAYIELRVEDKYGNDAFIDFYIYIDSSVENHLNAYPKGEPENSRYQKIEVAPGESVNLETIVSADDMSQITYRWYDHQKGKTYRGSSIYKTEPIRYNWNYGCDVRDQYGNSCSVSYEIFVANNLKVFPQGESEDCRVKDIVIEPGQSAELKAEISADDDSDLSITWFERKYVDEWDDYYNRRRIGGAYSSSYKTKPLEKDKTYTLNVVDRYGNTEEVRFNVIVKSLEKQVISANDRLSLAYGSSGTISVNGAQGTLNFTSSNPSVASVDSTGKVTANKVGRADITIYAAATDTHNESNKITVSVTVTPVSITGATVSGLQDKTFNNSEQTQTPVVKIGSTTLTEGTDYSVSYSNNVNAGKATVTITGKGNYTGTKDSAFTIDPASVKDAQVTGIVDKTYNGEEQTQTPVVKVGSATLKAGDDYTLSYSNNTNAGKATVTIAGKGNYTGTKDSAFTINPASVKDAQVTGIVDKTYNGEKQEQTPVVKVGSATLKEGDDYTLSYSNNTNAGKATVTITGKGNYTDTKDSAFTINPASVKDAQVTGIVDKAYNGEKQEQTPVVKVGSATLKAGDDYTLSYRDNVEKGTATVIITGKGNYTGTVERTFTISDKLSIETATVDKITGLVYNGKEQKPVPVVKMGAATLKEGTDYTIDSYSNNTNAGTATVTITGTGRYINSKTIEFTIAKAAQSFTVKAAASIDTGKTTRVTASGAKETKKYTFTSSNPKVATVNATGTVTGKAAGTVTITVKTAATTNYKAGSKTVKITVNKVLKKPGNCHFVKWNNSKYTSCRIAWNKVAGADGYQTILSWTDGTHASTTYTKSNVLYRNCSVHPQHVSQMKVRAFYMSGGRRKFGPWSNVEYITPSPTKLTTKNTSAGANLKMNLKWNIIYGCNGYNVFITTNPNGTWYWNQSTSQKATSTSAVITKYRGAKLKKNTRYYVRIVTRRKRNGVFCTVPMPANNTNIGSFIIK